jgi:hypothetical protein
VLLQFTPTAVEFRVLLREDTVLAASRPIQRCRQPLAAVE